MCIRDRAKPAQGSQQPQAQKSGKGGQNNGGQARPAGQNGGQAQNQGGQKQPQQQPAASRPGARVPEKKVVDTRKGGQVNLEKYDQRLEDLAAGKTKQMQGGKQKFQGRSQRKGGFQSGKRRQEEQEMCIRDRSWAARWSTR